MTSRVASCSCGALSITCEGEPDLVAVCHCLECKRRTGSAFGVTAFFPRGKTQPDGPAGSYTRTADSGRSIRFSFCPSCGSTVFWEAERAPGAMAVAVGAFADPAFPAPKHVAWPERAHDWVTVAT